MRLVAIANCYTVYPYLYLYNKNIIHNRTRQTLALRGGGSAAADTSLVGVVPDFVSTTSQHEDVACWIALEEARGVERVGVVD